MGRPEPWDLETTRSLISRIHGRRQLELAAPCLRSLMDRQFYSQFHYQRAQSGLRRYVRILLDSGDPLAALFSTDEPGWRHFNVVIRKLGADITACIQSLHTLPDILASAVYYSLALDRVCKPIEGKFVNHAFVVSRVLSSSPEFKEVRTHLAAISHGSEFKRLAGLANLSKHYSIVFPALNTDLTGTRAQTHALAIPEFSARGQHFPQVLVDDFLPAIHQQISRAIVDTGCATLAHLQATAAM
jgi:hypothetical protein